MKNTVLLIVLLLILPGMSFGDQGLHADNFSGYINSSPSDNSTVSPAIQNTNPPDSAKDQDRKQTGDADANPILQGMPIKWQACTKDSDCTSGVVDCVSWEGINEKYLKELSKNLRSCSASVDPGFQPQAACVDKVCKTTSKTSDVSWEDWLSEMRKKREGG